MSIVDALAQVVDKLTSMKTQNDALQSVTAVGSPAWHVHETIDDRIHEALELLGE